MADLVKITARKSNPTPLARKEDYQKLMAHVDVVFEYVECGRTTHFMKYEAEWYAWQL